MKLLPTLLVLCIILSACTGPDNNNVALNPAFDLFTYDGKDPIYEELSFEEEFTRQSGKGVHINPNGIQMLADQTVNSV